MYDEKIILELALANINKINEFDPYKSYASVSCRNTFKDMMARDPAFSALGLDDDRYVIARIGGNLVTSIHRKIGDMYEGIFAYLLKTKYGIPEHDLHYSVSVKIGGRTQQRSTDGLLKRENMPSNFPSNWLACDGVGFELRSCYQIGDSKRIQADYDMALALKEKNIQPVMLIFCNTSLKSPVARLSRTWELYEGHDSFEIVRKISDFDLYSFLQKNRKVFKKAIDNIFTKF